MRRHPSFATLGVLEQLSREDASVGEEELYFVGPDGRQMKLAHLPPRGLKDWRPGHKAMVVAAVRHGLITVDEACRRYGLSTDGYLRWYRCYAPQLSADG
jgi:hypothetical protein